MQKILILVMIGLLSSCGSKSKSVDEVRVAYQKFQADSIKAEEDYKNRYQFEYYQDPKTGICYSIMRSIVYSHGQSIVKSHTCVPCQEAGFTELKNKK